MSHHDIAGDVVVAHVVEREHPGRRVAHQQVGGVGAVKAADARHLQRRIDLAERAVEQDGVVADVVELVGAIGIAAASPASAVVPAGGAALGGGVNREGGEVAPLGAVIGPHLQGIAAIAGVEAQLRQLRNCDVDDLVGGFDNAIEHPMAAVGGGVLDLVARDRIARPNAIPEKRLDPASARFGACSSFAAVTVGAGRRRVGWPP